MRRGISFFIILLITITMVGCSEPTTKEKVIDYIEVNQSTINESYTIDDFALDSIEIYVYYTDETFETPTVFTIPGIYDVTVTDKAGNVTEYSFEII